MSASNFVVFLMLGELFFWFFELQKKLENRRIFCDVTDPEPGIWWGESGPDLSPLKI